MFMLWRVLISSEDVSIAPYSSTQTNATFLSLFLNVFMKLFRVLRGGCLLVGFNLKWYIVAKHIVTNVEVNPRNLSTFKNEKSIWSIKPEANFETSMLLHMVILVDLVKIQIGQGSSDFIRFIGRPFMGPLFTIFLSLKINTWPNCWWISWEKIWLDKPHTVGTKTSLLLWGLTLTISIWIYFKLLWVR